MQRLGIAGQRSLGRRQKGELKTYASQNGKHGSEHILTTAGSGHLGCQEQRGDAGGPQRYWHLRLVDAGGPQRYWHLHLVEEEALLAQ